MSKKRARQRIPPKNVKTVVPGEALGLSATPVASVPEVAVHHGNHRNLITEIASAHPRKPDSATAFENMSLRASAVHGLYTHVYQAAGRLVAVGFEPEKNFTCWNYYTYALPGESVAESLLGGTSPESLGLEVRGSNTKRNAIHAKLHPKVDMGRIADVGAAAAFVSLGVDIGKLSLPDVSPAGSAEARNDENQIQARIFSARGGVTLATSMTHLREDTTSILAFRSPNPDTITDSLARRKMLPGEACPPLPEFIDFSMFRGEEPAEAYIGQLLVRSLCEFTQ